MLKKIIGCMGVLVTVFTVIGCGMHGSNKNVNDQGLSSIVSSTDSTNNFFENYTIDSKEYGTETIVEVSDGVRSIKTNALPNHETGVFPNVENPNTISAQDNNYEIPTEGAFKNSQGRAREPGIAVNGIKFEPETNERVECETGETYRIEAKQETFKVIGLDEQHAHVQPTGTYHYHGVSQALVGFADTGDDLVHVGFAKDGFNIYYSKSGVYKPSYVLDTKTRSGDTCAYRGTAVDIEGTKPDGTYVSDWIYDETIGDLDECNGIMIDGVYTYLMTDEYPYISRCLNGETNEKKGPGGGPKQSGVGAQVVDNVQLEREKNIGDTAVISSYFEDDALVEDVTIVDCTLSDGTQTSCYSIVTTHGITANDIGPRCPRTISDSAQEGGIWIQDGIVNDVDGAFIANLDRFYDDDSWQMYDEETGEIYVTDSKKAFEGAAKPQVEEQYYNHCVEGLLSYVDEIPTVTYVIPVDPQKATATQGLSNPLGIAFNGIRFDAPAPVDAILAANTIAAFDDCGGHVNPHVGYHYHAETGCAPRVDDGQNHEALIGFAMDGFEIYEYNESINDLDECGGHSDEVRGYHYHIANAGENQHLGCLSGAYGCALTEEGICDASGSTTRRGTPPGGDGERRGPPPQK